MGVLRISFLLVLLAAIYFKPWNPKADLSVLDGKRIVITGGGSGIGAEMAREAFNRGASVVIIGRRLSRLEKVCHELQNMPGKKGRCFPVVGDMAVKEKVVHAVDESLRLLGGVDSLVLNHVWGVVKFFEDVPFDELEEVYQQTFNPNVLGCMWLIHRFLPHLKATTSRSHILYVSSLSHTYGIPKLSFYASSKLALHPVIDTLRMELGPKSNLTLTIAQVGAVSTEVFAEQMMNPKEEVERAMKPDKCARILLENMVSEVREVLLPMVDRPFPIPGHLSWMFPSLVEWMMRNEYNLDGERKAFLKDGGGKPNF